MARDSVKRTTGRLNAPSADWRERALAGGSHDAWFADAPCLHEIRVDGPFEAGRKPHRVLAWNAERLKHPDPSIDLLAPLAADVLLVTEVDVGMARSGNRDTIAELAQALGMGHAFGVEFIELGLGDAREREWHAGESNRHGLHGAGILSRCPLEDVTLLRLDHDGSWYAGERNGERRIGGRMAVIARIGGIVMASVHLESHSDPAHRAQQMRLVFEAVDELSGGGPAIVGGDLNSKSAARDDWLDDDIRERLLAEDPSRRMNPLLHEPMFEAAASFGYDIGHCNDGAASERLRPGDPLRELGRIDWFMTRGVDVGQARTIPAVDAAGIAVSDHEILSITLRTD
ncbi:MAG: endonuclease/exonuclease/phosphatase family protein [Geminicoccaceae bacterium]|nr:endonuclease/exonuclease/phosphatase family protein [Geminicoccaceae bacterium]